MCRSDSCCPYGMSQDGRDMNHTGMPLCVPFLATARFLPRLDSFLSGCSGIRSLSAMTPHARLSASRERLDRLIRSGRSDGGPLCKGSGRSIGNEAGKAA